MGPRVCQLLATLCVALSHTPFVLGDTDQTGGFCLRTLSFGRPMTIMGLVFDMVAISCDVEGPIHEESGDV
jgi:hypothetical protein